tara:strand:+ start:21560 stop:22678 length:1119 start_codon:yes stop_codon:yes gene_type:complete
MRQQDPLILGAGPAGCAAAIVLARGGAQPLLLDRAQTVGDPLCGGFLSWRTVEQLRALDVDPLALGAHPVTQLRLFAAGREATAPLPHPACGLSRHALDTALRQVAQAAGARLVFDHITAIEPGVAHGKAQDWPSESLFLASGKHDIRGTARPRHSDDPALGLRLRLPATTKRRDLLTDAIELHLFARGYAGIVLQEDGTANVCLALRKSALAEAGGSPQALLARLAAQEPALSHRLGDDWNTARVESIGAVPYGWIARDTAPGLFRLGDQAAVIPSLAGEGISIALASGHMAAAHWLDHGPEGAPLYQQAFARKARRPVAVARLARTLAESPRAATLAALAARYAPQAIHALASLSRIAAPPPLAQPARPA